MFQKLNNHVITITKQHRYITINYDMSRIALIILFCFERKRKRYELLTRIMRILITFQRSKKRC